MHKFRYRKLTLIEILFAVLQKFRWSDLNVFGCTPGHVIKIHSAEIGVIAFRDLTSDDSEWEYLMDHAECSWLINREHFSRCNDQQWCHLPPNVYNSALSTITTCAGHKDGNVIKITYNCIPDNSGGLMLYSFPFSSGVTRVE